MIRWKLIEETGGGVLLSFTTDDSASFATLKFKDVLQLMNMLDDILYWAIRIEEAQDSKRPKGAVPDIFLKAFGELNGSR